MPCVKCQVPEPAELSPEMGRAKGHQGPPQRVHAGWAATQLSGLLSLGWSTQCLQDWGPFFSLAVPSMLMICIEWWAYEIWSFLMGMWKSRVGAMWAAHPGSEGPPWTGSSPARPRLVSCLPICELPDGRPGRSVSESQHYLGTERAPQCRWSRQWRCGG